MSLVDEFLVDLEQMDGDQNISNDLTENISSIDNLPDKNNVHSIAKLKDSILLQEILKKIDFHTKHQRKSSTDIQGPIEHDPEYLLIVNANNLSVEIDNEIDIIHNFVKTMYHKRFPELQQLVPLPMNYLKTVKVSFQQKKPIFFYSLTYFLSLLGIRQRS